MDLIYKTKEFINTTKADAFGRLRPSALLEMMQEAAGMSSTALGAGWQTLSPRGLFWAVIRQRVELLRLPTVGETIVLETWPGEATRSAYPRYTEGRTEAGELLFRAAALWLIMDAESRAMILPGQSGVEVPGLTRKDQLPAPRSLPMAAMSREVPRQVQYSELDVNGHMSNTKYLNWMEDLLPSAYHREHPLGDFQISYLSEAHEGETLCLHWDMDETGVMHLDAVRPSGDKPNRVFAIRARYL